MTVLQIPTEKILKERVWENLHFALMDSEDQSEKTLNNLCIAELRGRGKWDESLDNETILAREF